MDERDSTQVGGEPTEHERRVAEVEETEQGGAVADPIAGADLRPSAEEDLAADREEPIDEEEMRQ